MFGLPGLLLFVLIGLGIAFIGLQFADDRSEEMLFLKLFGHALLGAFTFRINALVLPIGFPIALWMASNASVNQKARRVASGISFALWLISLLLF
ncbi:MAG: hypothetical protein K0R39_4465 [Symbiobacteriaceae bacterium]|nr:hypothetical protein [Symbiobacteriaceae bacterium]